MAGLERAGAGTAAAIVYLQPVLVVLGARAFLGERPGPRRLGGALLGFGGVATIGVRQLQVGSPAGVGLLLCAALSWAAGTLLLKLWAHRPLIPLVAAQNVYGLVPLVVLAAALEPAPHVTFRLAWTAAYAGVLASAGGWMLLAALLREHEAGAVSAFVFSVPLLGALFGIVLLGEPLHWSIVVGSVLVAAGVRAASAPARGPGGWRLDTPSGAG